MSKFIFAANFKCNHTRRSFQEYAEILEQNLQEISALNLKTDPTQPPVCKNLNTKLNSANLLDEVIVFPPSSAFLSTKFSFIQGEQNFYPCENGAFTGEIGAQNLAEFGIDCVLIGHSERREILGETNEILKAKFDFAMQKSWKIIFCIGESLEIYESKKTSEYLKNQLKIIDLTYPNLYIAYEPIWAIGSGKTPNIDEIEQILGEIRTLSDAPLLYGGSVNLTNIRAISSTKNCDGVLVGGASLDAQNFINLIKETKC